MMAGEPAAAAVAEGQPTEVTPVDGGAAPQPTGQPGGEVQPEGGEARPETGEPKAAGEPAPPSAPAGDEPHVPWARFREARSERARAIQELQEGQKEWSAREAELTRQIEELRGGDEQTQQVVSDYYQLAGALQAFPEIARQLEEAVARNPHAVPYGPPSGRPGMTPGRTAQPPPSDPRLDKVVQTIEKVDQRLTAAEQAQQQRQEREAQAKLDQQVSDRCTQFLESRGYDRSFLEDAKDYVFRMARTRYPDLQLDDIPFVLADWFKTTDGRIQGQVQRILEGKKTDAGLPPSPGGAQPPVRPATTPGANDATSAQQMEEALRRIGWSG